MSFRPRQRIQLAVGGDIVFSRIRQNESGQSERYLQNDSTAVLPDVETTDIKALLAAGIDPKQVNTRIVPSQSVVTDLAPEKTEQLSEEEK